MRRSAAWSMARWCRTRPSRICSSGRLTWFATSPPSLPWTPVMSSPPELWAGSATPEPRRATCRAARRWWQGSKASATRSARLDVQLAVTAGDDELSAPSALPGWTGRHILSHVGHNARALGRLAHWAATGEPTPMYSGPSARAAEIALGARWDADRLRLFVEVEQDALAAAFEKLDVEHWATEVVTAQGRHVTAAALPWLRTREVWVHAADLHGAA